jgi:hypothetical protein
MSDGYLWAADRGTTRILKYDLDGNFMYSAGHMGITSGRHVGCARDERRWRRNFYVAEMDNAGVQKYRPRSGANPAFLVGKPIRSAWR